MLLKEELTRNNYSIIASNGYYSYGSGISPVIDKINENRLFFKDLIVVDKIVGKASAMLLTYSGVKEVYALCLSKQGKQIFEEYGITYHYDELVDNIINRKKDGICPMEICVKDINSLNEAYLALKKKVEELKNEK